MQRHSFFKRIVSLAICLTMILAYLPAGEMKAKAADPTLGIVSDSKKADPSTLDGWKQYFGPDKLDTEFAGAVWTDKSVFTEATSALPGVSLTDSKNFLVALSAIASNLSIVGHTSAPTDTILVLDVSGSMVDDTFEVGVVRSGNQYRTAEGIDMSLINAMIEATNATIDKLMTQNTNNRVGVILYSGNADTDDPATPGTATVVLPLGRYTGVEKEYLSVDTTWQTAALYEYRNRRWQATGETATYVAKNTEVYVSVKNGLKTESGADVTDSTKRVNGGTYIQNGLYQAMNQFLSVSDTVVPEGKPQAGVERMPVLVLMSDGAPTIATSDYANVGQSNVGNGGSTNDRITFLTQLTAAYVRGRIAAKYQESATDDKDMLFLTLGLGTENSSAATNTLYPAGSNDTLVGYWDTYLAGTAGSNVQITTGQGGWSVSREAAVEAMNYVDKYFYANNAQGLLNSFNDILSEISLKAESYATLVESSGADFSGYVTFVDELGEMMQVAAMKGIIVSDGNGGKVLFTGKGIAESLISGNLGTVDTPTERGNELVRTVKERIPGLTTTQAQQLIGYAYNDRQLYYAGDNDWSNYIGWYADADGNYVGFWDKDSGYENAPAGAVYANRSYGYLGINGDSDMMHVVVMVQTKLSTLHQTVKFKIPASLLPIVQYKVTLDEDDPDQVESFVREDAIPMQLVFEVGLRPGINAINLEQKIQEHIAKGGHVHRNSDGTVTFYTNEWAVGNDTNGNGIPDPEEVETAIVTQSHFHPAEDNSRFYYTDDTVILTGEDSTVTGSDRPTDTDGNAENGTGYYYNRYIYSASGRTVIRTPIAAVTLANDAQYDSVNDCWYIPAGTMYHNLARFHTNKTENPTGTLYYSFYPAVFDSVSKQDVYTFLGNNGSFTVAPAQGIALTKTVAEISGEDGAPTSFTFTVTLSQAVANPLITDTDGTPLTGISTVSGNVITVTLKAGQTVVISGIPTGTTYTVEEEASRFYAASSGNASGTVSAYTIHAVDFVNTAKGFGSLVVSKDVNYPQGFAPGTAHNSKTFNVHVTFTGDTTGMTVPQGAVQNGSTYTLTLKDGQSATFANIPEGVTYTVTEDGIPAGYELQDLRYSDGNQKIDGKDLDEAHVVNRYTLQPVAPNVKVQGDKTLITNESSWNGQTFTVELLEIIHFADEDPVSTGLTATISEANPHYEIDLSTLSFDQAGTYYFRVVEQIPTDRNENIAYDRSFGLFSVTVGDADADGNLEIQSVAGYQNTALSGDSANGWILEKDFTNMVTTDRLYLDVQKYIVDADTNEPVNTHLGDITFGLFKDMTGGEPAYYALTDTHGKATLMIPVTKEFIAANGQNGQLIYYMREVAPEVANRVTGMKYDESWIYAISITWDDVDNKAVMEYAPIENGQIGTYAAYTEGVTFTHTNTYESDVSVELDLSGNKTLNGGTDLGGREFSFSLFASTAAFVKGDRIQNVTNNGNAIAFDNITFTAPGVYYMVVKEDASTLGGITVDSTEYHITVEVERFSDTDGTTRLRLVDGYPTVVAYGTSENVGANGLNFNNIYTVTGSGNVTIGGEKVLSGRAMVAGEFTIGLYSDAECTDLIETTVNKADGTFAFSTMTYTAAHLGVGYAEKTYTYYVKEVPGSKGGVTYDPNVYTVTVTVSHEAGALVVTPSDNAASLQITNTYSAQPVDTTINGSKVLSGDWSSVANKDFTFQLFQANSAFVITNPTPVQTKTVTGNAGYSMTLHYEDGDEGYYYYVLKEDISAQAGGVGYDAGEYHITVNVTDPGEGQLAAFVTVYRPGTGNTQNIVFTNSYTVEPTTITLEGIKNYTNSVSGDPMPMDEGMFSFMVLEGADHLVSTGYNKADGTIVFEPIRYTAAGVHTYRIIEVPGDAGGVTYDENKVFTVKVTVVDNGDGTLTATADYNGTPVVFENKYTHESAQVTFNGEKFLSGDWGAVLDANKVFTFELYETDDTFTVTGDPVDFVNSAEGSFTFGTRTYTGEGTHYYVVLERKGADNKGITYDETRYHITVVVDDNGSGKLIPTVTADKTSVTITPDTTDNALVTVDGLDFTNSYTAGAAQYTPEVTKDYEREGEMKEFDFTLSVDGTDKQTKKNDSDGKVVFETLNFQTAGVYELKIREEKNILWGLIRWDTNVYTITLHVEDNGTGRLFVNEAKTVITSEKGTTDLVFRNADHNVITNKDVFLLSQPTVSIDGKAVEKNDILVYKISYTNFDGIPVNVEITDTIPAHTVYVENSADNGGVLVGNTLRWNLQNVAPDETVTVSFQVKVDGTGDTVTNSAVVLEGGNRYETKTVSNSVKEDKVEKDVVLPGSETVSIDGKKVEKGDILIYKITYTNADDFPADVTITDTIPAHTTYMENTASDGGTYAEGVITWNLHLDPNTSKTVTFWVKVTDTNGPVVNQATAKEGENILDTESVTNPVKEDTLDKDVFLPGSETVSIDGKKVEKGDILLYKITYTNADDFPADVTITDTIPAHTAYVNNSVSDGGTYAEGVVTWNLHLEPGTSKSVTFEVVVTGEGGQTVTNQASALEGQNRVDSDPVTNPITKDQAEKHAYLPGNETVIIDNEKVEKGDVLIYKITYTNNDDFPADVTITDVIPEHTTYVENSASDGATLAGGKLTWNLRLDPGETKTVTFRVKVADTRVTVENTATVKEGSNEFTTNSTRLPVEQDLVSKDVFLPGSETTSINGEKVEKGDILLYKITYQNLDGFDANVTITDIIPAYTTYVENSASDGATFAGGKLTWNLQLGAGESKTVTFKVEVTGQGGQTVSNQATAQEGTNILSTEQVTNPITEDTVKKDVAMLGNENVTIDGKKVEKGDVLIYKITYTNNDGFAADVTITDIIPAYTTYVENSASDGATFAGGKLTWNLHLEPGASKTVTFQVTVTGQGGQEIANQATAQEGENIYNTDPVKNPITEDEAKKDVVLSGNETVTIDGKKVEKGDELIYKITYVNSDDFPADVTITDMIPAYTAYVENSASDGAVYAEGKLTWNLHLEPGASKTVTFKVTVTGQGGQEIANQATAQEGENTYNTESVKNPITDDKMEKDVFLPGSETVSIDGKKVEKGDILVYKITYTNTDDFPANVTITDTLSAYTAYVEGSASDGGICNEGVITWNLQLDPGASKTVTFKATVTGKGGQSISNQASALEGSNRIDTESVTNPITDDKAEKEAFLVGSETVSIDGKKVEKGDILLYKITYTNADDFPADVTITDIIPHHTIYVEGSASDGAVYAEGKLVWNLQLAAGASKTVTFRVKVADDKVTVENTASAKEGSNEIFTNSVRNSVEQDLVSKDVFLPGAPTVSIDGKVVELGDVLLYKITYQNLDGFDANVVITDVIPEHTAYVTGSADHGGTYAGGKLTWNLQLAGGESKTVSFQVKVVGTNAAVVNQATAQDGQNTYSTNKVTNPVKEDTVKKDVFLSADPTVSIDGKVVEKGDELVYKITYTNTDDFAANVTITDTIPANTAYVEGSADNGGTFAGGKLIWNLQLAAGETKTVTFKVTVTGESDEAIANQASAQEGSNQYQTNAVTNPVKEDTLKKDVFLSADPTVSIDGKKVEKGDILVYKITYTNTDDFAANVTITDSIPAFTVYVEGSADNGATFADGKLTWNLQLAAGETKTVSFQVTVTGKDGQSITNQASALEGTNRIETAQVTTSITEDKVEKDVFQSSDPTVSVDGEKIENGKVLVYTITYTNADDFSADVTITDTIPAGTTYVEGSADNGAIFADGKLTWNLQLAAGETKTVSFQVTVTGNRGQSVTNQASAQEGENRIETNQITNTVYTVSVIPETGDNMHLGLLLFMMLSSVVCLFVLVISRKHFTE